MKKILINLTSIRSNPDYPSFGKKYVPGLKTITFSFKGEKLPEFFEDTVNCTLDRWEFNTNGTGYESIHGYITDHTLVSKILELPKAERNQFTVTLSQEQVEIRTLEEEPKYLFDYEPTMVKCRYCGAEFDHEELGSDSIYNGMEDLYDDAVCPECDGWDCCEIEYETIQEALGRKAVAEAPTVDEFKHSIDEINDMQDSIAYAITGIKREDIE